MYEPTKGLRHRLLPRLMTDNTQKTFHAIIVKFVLIIFA